MDMIARTEFFQEHRQAGRLDSWKEMENERGVYRLVEGNKLKL